MHSYLKSVGFSGTHTVADINALIGEIISRYDDKIIFENTDGRYMAQISRLFGPTFGLSACGEYDSNGAFFTEYVVPFVLSSAPGAREEVILEKHVAQDAYSVACDDLRVGTTLIFYLSNMGEYLSMARPEEAEGVARTIDFSALASSGTILLPMERQSESEESKRSQVRADRRELLRAAKEGDETAMEDLTIADFDTYSMLIERATREDLFTIVDTYFMPDGAECERYSILGTILSCDTAPNLYTGEDVITMDIECNDIRMTVAANAADIVGDPAPGRRFKGYVWLCGHVHFEE